MKKNKLLLMIISILLILTPCYANANTTTNGNNEQTIIEGENTNKEETTGGEQTETPKDETNNESKPSEEENNKEEETSKPVEENTIKLDKTELELGTKKEATLKATVTPSDAIIEWSSDNEDVATVDQNGKITTKKIAGTAIITATIKDTETKATCTVKVTRTVSKDATLKNLIISNGTLDKSFDSSVVNYKVTVDSKVNSLKFKDLESDLNDENAKYFVTGNEKLKNDDVVEIKVIAEDGTTTKIYKLTIVKDTVNLNLKSLRINGYALNETFEKDKLEYTASIPYEIETISIQAAAEDSDAEVKVTGITNLKVGENIVTVSVKDQSDNNRTYKIIVTREKEVSVEENPTSIITSSSVTDEDNSSTNTVTPNTENNNDNNDGSDDFLKYAIVSLACLILFIIGGIGIYFYLKTSPKKLRKELSSINQEETVSPIVEVEPETENKNQVNIEEIMQEDLVQTKEFKKEELDSISKTENLFDDSEDV